MTFHLPLRRPHTSLDRKMHKGGGGSAPAAPAPIPPVAERGSDQQAFREDAMRAAARKKGNRSTILGGALGVPAEAAAQKAFGQRTLLGSASN